MSLESFLQNKKEELVAKEEVYLRLMVKPNGKNNIFTKLCLDEETVCVSIKAPPIDGAANLELIKFISKYFKIAKSMVKIKRGHNGRMKTLILNS